jgi:hypothetical protein
VGKQAHPTIGAAAHGCVETVAQGDDVVKLQANAVESIMQLNTLDPVPDSVGK